ncbi:hypothetical protein GCM10010256_45700 [Streptomyces coeruleorubidus]|nr:hypothetical protein GCM10010256_45700 [Streptomyces coeruleorubidus]
MRAVLDVECGLLGEPPHSRAVGDGGAVAEQIDTAGHGGVLALRDPVVQGEYLVLRRLAVRPVWLMWRRGPLSPAAQAFIEVAREVFTRPVAASPEDDEY